MTRYLISSFVWIFFTLLSLSRRRICCSFLITTRVCFVFLVPSACYRSFVRSCSHESQYFPTIKFKTSLVPLTRIGSLPNTLVSVDRVAPRRRSNSIARHADLTHISSLSELANGFALCCMVCAGPEHKFYSSARVLLWHTSAPFYLLLPRILDDTV